MGNYTLYKLYKLQRKPKGDTGATWQDVVPSVYSYDGDGTKNPVVVEENSTQCGYTPPIEPQYRWVNMDSSIDYYCQGTTKYYKQKKQVSMDSGSTWTDMSPMEYRMGTMAEANSVDCGAIELQYKWVNITPTTASSSYWCDDCPPSYESQYLTFVAQESGTFSFTSGYNSDMIYYSLDSGTTWSELYANRSTPTVNANSTVMWKSTISPNTYQSRTFSSTRRFYVEGNVMSLLYGDNFGGQTSLEDKDWAFLGLFATCSMLTSAENLILPSTTLSVGCYSDMFAQCTSLTTVPELPATTLASSCYYYMFQGCTSLTTAPQLPATTLTNNCYAHMFEGCTSLTTTPTLSVTTLANSCYAHMFEGCASLVTPPQLPATTLAENCYKGMFIGCTSLTTAPTLSATTLTNGCYSNMFARCSSLTTAPQLQATTLANNCYEVMFYNCTSLTTAPQLPATTLSEYCYQYMFNGCTSLTTAPQLPATTLAQYCYSYMFYGCSSLATPPQLPATTLSDYCYNSMFVDCTSLTTAPQLPATTLSKGCYSWMFAGSSLTTSPQLPARTLVASCYENMFLYCTSLNSVTCLATSISASKCTDNWLYGVAANGTFIQSPNMPSWSRGSSAIPSGWVIVDYSN